MKRFGLTMIYTIVFIALPVLAEYEVPPSLAVGLAPVGAIHTVVLPPVDVPELIREDEENAGTGVPLRIGIGRPLPAVGFETGETVFDPEAGLIWRLRIQSPGARQMRVHIRDMTLQGNSSLYIYHESQEISDVYTGLGPFSSGDFWSWATEGEIVIVEWNQPDIIGDGPWNPPFTISEIAHAYRGIPEPPESDPGREQWCHNDATCDTGYRAQRDASAYISFYSGGWYICSGTMLNNTQNDFRPFFMTANHCIGNQSEAESVQVYFYYYTAVCNSGSASFGTAKNGANLRATGTFSNSSDFSLLELTSSGFTGVYFAGWDRSSVAMNEAVTSIHHPDGSYRRISYGSRIDYFGYPDFWDVRWNRTSNPGVTEPGSSGGGLFRDSNHLFIGQLYGGTSDCDAQSNPDTYGRFSVSYTDGNLQNWLGSATTVQGMYFGSGPTATPGPPTQTPSTPPPTGTAVPTNTPIPSNTPSTPPPTGTVFPTSTPAGPSPTRTVTPVPTETVPPGHPTNTPIPTHTAPPGYPTPTALPTETPVPTRTPTAPPGYPTYTAHPDSTNTPYPTFTPGCGELGCTVYMPSHDFGPYDVCYCTITVCNPDGVVYHNILIFAILDLFGSYFFAPGYTEFGCYVRHIPPGMMELNVLPAFIWPAGAGAAVGARWYAAMTDPEMTELFGRMGTFTFGWHT
ncbi:hypothetical protein JXA40_07925 [bacterium]|nr:hypothetical protein [candidate division CSSED10-310 bacterium]